MKLLFYIIIAHWGGATISDKDCTAIAKQMSSSVWREREAATRQMQEKMEVGAVSLKFLNEASTDPEYQHRVRYLLSKNQVGRMPFVWSLPNCIRFPFGYYKWKDMAGRSQWWAPVDISRIYYNRHRHKDIEWDAMAQLATQDLLEDLRRGGMKPSQIKSLVANMHRWSKVLTYKWWQKGFPAYSTLEIAIDDWD